MMNTNRQCNFSTLCFSRKSVICITLSTILILTQQMYVYHQSVMHQNQATVNLKPQMRTYFNKKIKYIVQWTSSKNVPFVYMGKGNKIFFDNKCAYTNCVVVSSEDVLDMDITQFDAVIFAGPEVVDMSALSLPRKRSPHQKYVFASIESPHYYPACRNHFIGYFNWTWTYKLDSDARWGYIIVRDSSGNIIGPNKDMHWINHDDMLPVTETLTMVLKSKKYAVAWFVSNCETISEREKFAVVLDNLLQSKYSISIDFYGHCGRLKCSKGNIKCYKMIKNYYFYLSFENALSEDYVTEKLLLPLQYNAIPIVYGGANYSRFMPEMSYLNARELGVEKLAAKIHELLNDFDKYSEYFRWTNHYSYHARNEVPETNDYCGFCALLNEETKMRTATIYQNISSWWNSPFGCSDDSSFGIWNSTIPTLKS